MSIVIPENSRSPHPRAEATTEPTKLYAKGSPLMRQITVALYLQNAIIAAITLTVLAVTR